MPAEALTDTGLTQSDSAATIVARRCTDTGATNTESIVRAIRRSRSDTGTTQTDSISRSAAWTLPLADTACSISDSILIVDVLLSDTGVSQTDSIARGPRTLFRSINVTGAAISTPGPKRRFTKLLADTGITFSDAITLAPVGTWFYSLSDTGAAFTVSVTRQASRNRAITQNGSTITDSIRAVIAGANISLALSDTGTSFSDSLFAIGTAYSWGLTDTGSNFNTIAVDQAYRQGDWLVKGVPPTNNNFANRTVLVTSPLTGQSNYGSWMEPGETAFYGSYYGDQGVWYDFTPPTTGQWAFDISSIDPGVQGLSYLWIAFYTGTDLSSLVYVGGDSGSSGDGTFRALLTLTSGTAYKIKVLSVPFGLDPLDEYTPLGTWDIAWALSPDGPEPSNNDLAAAVAGLFTLAGTGTVTGTVDGADVEAGAEYDTWNTGRSVWYKIDAAAGHRQVTLDLTVTSEDPGAQEQIDVFYDLTNTATVFDDLTYSNWSWYTYSDPIVVPIPSGVAVYLYVSSVNNLRFTYGP